MKMNSSNYCSYVVKFWIGKNWQIWQIECHSAILYLPTTSFVISRSYTCSSFANIFYPSKIFSHAVCQFCCCNLAIYLSCILYLQVPKKVTVIKQRKDIKVILLGRSGSGKSRFFQRALGNTVKETTTTVSFSYICSQLHTYVVICIVWQLQAHRLNFSLGVFRNIIREHKVSFILRLCCVATFYMLSLFL